jgi:predicted CoA-binding protein
MSEHFENPSMEDIRTLLEQVKTIAVMGLSDSPLRPSYGVAKALQGFGYRIIPVNPGVDRVLGEQSYPDLKSLPEPVDLVDVFRASHHVAGIVKSCIALQLPALWLQDGVIDETAALRAKAAGMQVVMNRCVYRDYLSLF